MIRACRRVVAPRAARAFSAVPAVECQVESRLGELGHALPALPPAPRGAYAPCVRDGSKLIVSGHMPQREDGSLLTGCLGDTCDVETGRDAARLAALSILATVKAEIGSLERVTRVHKLVGFVNCTSDFTEQTAVLDGASNLLFDLLGEKGVHARSAVGTGSLPLGIPVEIEAIVEFE